MCIDNTTVGVKDSVAVHDNIRQLFLLDVLDRAGHLHAMTSRRENEAVRRPFQRLCSHLIVHTYAYLY